MIAGGYTIQYISDYHHQFSINYEKTSEMEHRKLRVLLNFAVNPLCSTETVVDRCDMRGGPPFHDGGCIHSHHPKPILLTRNPTGGTASQRTKLEAAEGIQL